MDQPRIETLTVKEAVDELRMLGMSITPERLRAGINQGVFPFGICIKMKDYEFEIYRVPFEKWKSERVS